MVNVVIGILKDKENFFIAKRKSGSHQGLKWEFPGGKPELDETDITALKREFKEELGIDIQVKDFICELIYKYPAMDVKVRAYYVDTESKSDIRMIVHEDMRWVNRRELSEYDLVGADIEIIKKIPLTILN